ncbi:MAG: hypothetical protein WC181_04160 [Defluviitoga sp.]|nr:hypothetical protein [Defluviitoga tunisiensis]
MKKIFYILLFVFFTLTSFATDYLGDIEFIFDQNNVDNDVRIIRLTSAQTGLSSELSFNSNYNLFCYPQNININYLTLSGGYEYNDFVIRLDFQKRALWEANYQKILLLEGQRINVGQVILKANGVNIKHYNIVFTVPTYDITYSATKSKLVFDFTPLYEGETNSIWWKEDSSSITFSSNNLPPLNLRVHLQPVNQEFEFLTDELKLKGTQSPYFSGSSINFSVQVGTNIGNHYNNYAAKLQKMYFDAGCPQEGLHVADAVVSIPMEGGYYYYLAVPVYYLLPAPSIDIVIGGSFHLVFNPANPENGYTSVVPVTITSSIPSFNINLNLELFNEYNLLHNYIFLINEQTIPVSNGQYSFNIQLKANFADLWNQNKEQILSLFQDNVLTVDNDVQIGNVYITLSSS